ncbi:MAG: DUF3341 domain-containing protein [Byssovorax sp.]
MRSGVLGEFMTPEAMIAAIVSLRDRGYRRLDAFSPYPVHGAEEAAGTPRSPLGWIAFQLGLAGAGAAYLLQWYCNAYDYPLNVGGRPLHSAPAFIPITFEMGVLSAATAGLIAYLAFTGLPELWSPVFEVEGFERASIDRFWVGVDVRDPRFDRAAVEQAFAELGAARVAWAGPRRSS